MWENAEIADQLARRARQLETDGANVYHVRAYRNAAEWCLSFDKSLQNIFQLEGRAGLRALPGIGRRLAARLGRLIRTGCLDKRPRRVRCETPPTSVGKTDSE